MTQAIDRIDLLCTKHSVDIQTDALERVNALVFAATNHVHWIGGEMGSRFLGAYQDGAFVQRPWAGREWKETRRVDVTAWRVDLRAQFIAYASDSGVTIVGKSEDASFPVVGDNIRLTWARSEPGKTDLIYRYEAAGTERIGLHQAIGRGYAYTDWKRAQLLAEAYLDGGIGRVRCAEQDYLLLPSIPAMLERVVGGEKPLFVVGDRWVREVAARVPGVILPSVIASGWRALIGGESGELPRVGLGGGQVCQAICIGEPLNIAWGQVTRVVTVLRTWSVAWLDETGHLFFNSTTLSLPVRVAEEATFTRLAQYELDGVRHLMAESGDKIFSWPVSGGVIT